MADFVKNGPTLSLEAVVIIVKDVPFIHTRIGVLSNGRKSVRTALQAVMHGLTAVSRAPDGNKAVWQFRSSQWGKCKFHTPRT